MVYLGTQYYRPPFPIQKYWEDDMKAMLDSGLNTIQLWVVWGWVEAEAGIYNFGDYDRLVELAEKTGLKVVLSTIAELHPYWIHREEPGSEMVTNMGAKVVSSNRRENHYGLTPGGCFDHPGVWNRMKGFIEATVKQYRDSPALIGWDAWNEQRWNVQADGLVCYCPHTINSFRHWLDKKYGGLKGLNDAWMRRYPSWEDVLPGKYLERPYTEMMAFQDFLTHRSNQHALARYRTIKALDPTRETTVHDAAPTILHGVDAFPEGTSLHRGNDWDLADGLDGIGCSSFPLWGGIEMHPIEVHNRYEFLRSAARDKKIWLSELQGGRYNVGFRVGESVDAVRQQRWIWNGYAIGADKVLFWCWRDEVFGRESNGFGFVGNDGLRDERIAAMKKTGALIREHGAFLESYRADRSETGILFSPETYRLYWSQEGDAKKPLNALMGYAEGLMEIGIPFDMVEENHLDDLAGKKLLFAARSQALSDKSMEGILEWVRSGGTLVAETEMGAFSPQGFYRYPEDRLLAKACGVRELGRRMLAEPSIRIEANGTSYTLAASDWTSPMADASTAVADAGSAGASGSAAPSGGSKGDIGSSLYRSVRLGKGTVVLVGSYLGNGYKNRTSAAGSADGAGAGFLRWLGDTAATAGVHAPVVLNAPAARSGGAAGPSGAPGASGAASPSGAADRFPLYAKLGWGASTASGGAAGAAGVRRRAAFLFLPGTDASYDLTIRDPALIGRKVRELVTDTELDIMEKGEVRIPRTPWGVAILMA